MPTPDPNTTPDTVAAQVNAQVTDARVRLALLMAPFLEGGGPTPIGAGGWSPGDGGHSFGPYQINLPFHPSMTQQSAMDPARAVAYMLPAYQNAVNAQPASLWTTNPELAAEQAIQAAENPATDYYTSHGAASVHSAYLSGLAAVGNPSIGGAGPSTGGLGPLTPAPGIGPVGGITGALQNAGTLPGFAVDTLGNAAGSVAGALLGPIERFVTNGALVVLGVIIGIIALVLLARASMDSGNSSRPVVVPAGEADAAAAGA